MVFKTPHEGGAFRLSDVREYSQFAFNPQDTEHRSAYSAAFPFPLPHPQERIFVGFWLLAARGGHQTFIHLYSQGDKKPNKLN